MSATVIRHWRPIIDSDRFVGSTGFERWIYEYDAANLTVLPTNDKRFKKIYASSLSRSIRTAEYFEFDTFESLPIFDEVPIRPVFDTNLKAPVWVWLFVGRIAWLFGHSSQPESFLQTLRRARSAAKIIRESDDDTLVVSHGLFMTVLRIIRYR